MAERLVPGFGAVADELTDDVLIPGFGVLGGSGTDTEAPTWPVGAAITPSNVAHDGFDLTWTAATDNVGVTGYRYRLNAGAWTDNADTDVAVTGLAAGTEYDVDVQAKDAAGNWSTSLTYENVTTDSIGIEPTLFDGATERTSETGIYVLVLAEAPGSTATPTVLYYSSTGTTDGSGVLSVTLNTTGVAPDDVVWLIAIKSDGDPANAGWSVCWPQTVAAI